MQYRYGTWLAATMACILLVGCDRQDTPTEFDFVDISTPDNFLKYPNPYPSLPAGSYTLVAATASAGENDTFTLQVTYDDGSKQLFPGTWTNSGGRDAPSVNNQRFTISLDRAGGLTAGLLSGVDNYLYLLDSHDNILFEDDNSNGATNALINLPKSRIDTAAWTQAYYAAIDPMNERTTLSAWMTKNGFDAGEDVHVIFRDTKDLGYGRDMHARRNANGCIAIYVRNFAVNLVDGMPYNTLNLTAAVQNDSNHHFGTNAIEFSDLDGNCDGADPMFAKFFTFKAYPANPSADETRLDKIDLDHRGAKQMPGPCILCHGGSAYPLLADGTFPSAALPGDTAPALRIGDVNARMQPLEVDTFEFTDLLGYSRANQEPQLHELNKMVYETFNSAVIGPGEWSGDFIREVVNGWYNGDVTDDNNATFTASFIPAGWTYDPNDNNPPAAAEDLFLKVVKPYCFACHSKRGTPLGSNVNAGNNGKDLDFSTYEKFISYAPVIEDYVYVRGMMPLSRLTFDKFWESEAPEILATHIPGFSHGNPDGSINQPGAPVANPGLSRTTNTPVTLSAASSLFANHYSWSITSSPGSSNPSLSDSNTIRPTFTTDLDGIYVIQLVVSNGAISSLPATLTLTVNNSLPPAFDNIRFTDIRAILQNADTIPTPATSPDCMACHVEAGAAAPATPVPGIAVYYSDDGSPEGIHDLYLRVRNRINFDKPELSPLLLKPSGNHHYGGLRTGFDLAGDHSNYDLFLNWIMNGAREN